MGIFWLAIIGSTIWVGIDASNLGMKRGRLGGGPIDMGVVSWVLCCLFLWVISFPCYLVARSRYKALPAAGWQQSYGAPAAVAAPENAWAMPQVHAVGTPVGTTVVPAQVVAAQPVAPPQYSPDGHWWWNGQEWVPAQR